ncbi:DMT family transporter [Halalkalibacter sp. APA_J-10(15)]|uniref:DMT family transporter n=1 Tax=Halalkalibacter sp. APA_J-10(15) TaxID=2933805 RepID=UPI001FF61B1B|nr:DMT family transporter [Halalkalibacter sp. APA_J-10(15)]MCK0472042.1 DMT family transporter [Halalkalibacter sp. APA_J-10(15)]
MKHSLLMTYGVILFVMMIWGVNAVMLKILVEHFPSISMTSLRIMLAGIVVMAIIFLARNIRNLTAFEWKYTLLGALFGVVGHHFFLAEGLVHTGASNAVLILALLPVTTSILAVWFLHDRLTRWRLFGIGIAFFGVFFIQSGSGTLLIDKGEMYIFIAMLLQAISFVYIKLATKTLDSKQMTGYMLVIGSFGLFIISFIIEPNGIQQMSGAPMWVYGVFAISAIVATAIGHFLFNAAIEQIGAGQTAIFNNFVPFFGLISSAIFLGEQIFWYQGVGFIFIVIGVLFGTGYMEHMWFSKERAEYKKRAS